MPRRTMTEDTAFDEIYNYLMRVEVALSIVGGEGDKEVQELVAPVSKQLGHWEDLAKERREQQRAVIRVDALVAVRNVKLDAVTTALHNATISAADQKRTAPLFKLLFPKPLSQVVPAALEAQLPPSRELHTKLADAQVPAALRKDYDKPLAAAIAAGETAIKQREATNAATNQLSSRIAALRDDANATLLIIEGQLKTLAGKRGLDTTWVNAFFPAAKAKPKKTKTPATPTN